MYHSCQLLVFPLEKTTVKLLKEYRHIFHKLQLQLVLLGLRFLSETCAFNKMGSAFRLIHHLLKHDVHTFDFEMSLNR